MCSKHVWDLKSWDGQLRAIERIQDGMGGGGREYLSPLWIVSHKVQTCQESQQKKIEDSELKCEKDYTSPPDNIALTITVAKTTLMELFVYCVIETNCPSHSAEIGPRAADDRRCHLIWQIILWKYKAKINTTKKTCRNRGGRWRWEGHRSKNERNIMWLQNNNNNTLNMTWQEEGWQFYFYFYKVYPFFPLFIYLCYPAIGSVHQGLAWFCSNINLTKAIDSWTSSWYVCFPRVFHEWQIINNELGKEQAIGKGTGYTRHLLKNKIKVILFCYLLLSESFCSILCFLWQNALFHGSLILEVLCLFFF